MKKILILGLLLLVTPAFYGFKSPKGEAKIKNIILMIGDGMGLGQITAGMIAEKNKTALQRCKHIGLITTFSADNILTDSAAGATAFSTGKKTNNGVVGKDRKLKDLPTILELAHAHELSTGLVATSYIQHATPACFYAHQSNRNMYEAISQDLWESDVDIAIGGGRQFFENLKLEKSLVEAFAERGFEYFSRLKKAEKNATSKRVVVLAKKDHLPPMSGGRGKFLSKGTDFAINRLKQNENGFFLMVEGSQIDWGGHANDKDYIISEVLDFNRVINQVLDFADADGETLVIITADHETGGFAIEGGSIATGEVEADFTTGGHSGTMVPVFAYGLGADDFMGIYDNTEIFHKIRSAFGF